MPLYVMLTRMNQPGLQRCTTHEATYHQELKSNHQNGEVLDFYAVIGQYDYVIMAHATNIQKAALLSGEISLKMDMTIETLPALRANLNEESATPPEEATGVREPNPTTPPSRATGVIVETPKPDRQHQTVAEVPQHLRTPRQNET